MPLNPLKIDLTASGNFGMVDEAVFSAGLVNLSGLSGTGIFNTFLQLQHKGIEQGYNTDAAVKQFDESTSAQHNHSLLLANIPIVIGDGTHGTVEGIAYRQFLIDANEAQRLLSLDELQIWQEESGNLTNFTSDFGFAGTHTNFRAFDLDSGGIDRSVTLNAALSNGSGKGDVTIFIPDSFFINDAAHRYVYLYSLFGSQVGASADGGFEEWGVAKESGGPGTTAALAVHKTATVPGGTANQAGEVITYTIKVDNVGDKDLTSLTVSDPSVSDLAGVDANNDGFNDGDLNHDNKLSVGEQWSFTAHYTVTQADIDTDGGGRGVINNTVTADTVETAPVSASASVQIERNISATLEKTASVQDGTADSAGDLITYTIALTNTGAITLTNPVVSDPMAITQGPPVLDFSSPALDHNVQVFVEIRDGDFNLGDTNQNGVWDASETFQYAYRGDIDLNGFHDPGETWQAFNLGDVNRNGIHEAGETWAGDTNQNGIEDPGERWLFQNIGDTNGNHLQDPGETWQYVNLGDNNQNGIEDPGEVWQFRPQGDTNQNGVQDPGETFTFFNVGDTNRNGVEDPGETFQFSTINTLAAVDANSDGFNDGDTNLDGQINTGETWQYKFTHTLTQAEIDNNGVVDPNLALHNTATASTDQADPIASDSESVHVVQRPELTLLKTAAGGTYNDANQNGRPDAGETISYSFNVTNSGNMTLHSIAVTDPALTVNGTTIASLAPNASDGTSFTGTYTIQQADIDAGFFDNTASATGSTGGAQGSTITDNDSEHVVLPQDPSLLATKTGAWADGADADGFADPGELVNYTVTVFNNGNVTLHDVSVTDPLVATWTRGADVVGDNDALLEVGETWSYTGSHAVTQSEIDAGTVHNVATASALGPQGQSASDDDDNDEALPQNAHVVATKSGTFVDGDADGFADPNELVNYTVTVANDGNVTLQGVSVTDPLVSSWTRGADVFGDNDALLEVGETWSYTGSHAITQTEIDAGTVHNTATVSASGPQNQPASDTASADVTLPPGQPAAVMSLDISDSAGTHWVDSNETGVGDAGDLIQFAIILKNLSNGTLSSLTVSDLLGDAVPGNFQTAVPASLASSGSAGDTWTSTYNHELTPSDINAGHVYEELTVEAFDSASQLHSITAHYDQFFPI